VADALSSYWANFAAKGDPNGKGLPFWPAFRKSDGRPMVLGDEIKIGPEPDKAKLDFFEAYYSSLYRPEP
jgi:para-nitrobenzyl esterase